MGMWLGLSLSSFISFDCAAGGVSVIPLLRFFVPVRIGVVRHPIGLSRVHAVLFRFDIILFPAVATARVVLSRRNLSICRSESSPLLQFLPQAIDAPPQRPLDGPYQGRVGVPRLTELNPTFLERGKVGLSSGGVGALRIDLHLKRSQFDVEALQGRLIQADLLLNARQLVLIIVAITAFIVAVVIVAVVVVIVSAVHAVSKRTFPSIVISIAGITISAVVTTSSASVLLLDIPPYIVGRSVSPVVISAATTATAVVTTTVIPQRVVVIIPNDGR
mmetsp:Transcript_47008/g.142341  ORF Transcript_47008/g.142341 Transcript_47008/m.142341 type:complete len:275 (-) Transcript_47008:362-1186(-)